MRACSNEGNLCISCSPVEAFVLVELARKCVPAVARCLANETLLLAANTNLGPTTRQDLALDLAAGAHSVRLSVTTLVLSHLRMGGRKDSSLCTDSGASLYLRVTNKQVWVVEMCNHNQTNWIVH
jgi:hypothetical protein